MLDHISRSELACPTTGKVYIATNFSEAPERLRVELDASLYLTSALRSPALIQGRPVVLAESGSILWLRQSPGQAAVVRWDCKPLGEIVTARLAQKTVPHAGGRIYGAKGGL